jgi:low affinity Fe/Cu permease
VYRNFGGEARSPSHMPRYVIWRDGEALPARWSRVGYSVAHAPDIEARRGHVARQLQLTRRGRARADGTRPVVLKRRWSSRQLHLLGLAVSHSWAGMVVFLAALVWIAIGLGIGFTTTWQAGLACTTSIVTVVMLFAIQHLQSRDQAAAQRKLDEILRSLPGTDKRLISVEDRSDEELEVLAAMNREDRGA